MTIYVLTCFFLLTSCVEGKNHTFSLGKEDFLLDEKPYQIISGELHPARIPEEYWRQRIQMVKAMGCNTIAAYIFWNYHEQEEGIFDFSSGNKNIAKFVRIAQEEGMWVLLRPGPYVCAEWDFGGLPPYLLSIPDIKIRCMDSRYTEAVLRYAKNLASEVKDLQVTKGGPILMVQVENEYGSYGNDREYLAWLKKLWMDNGVDVPFYTADGARPHMLEAGTLPGVAIGLDPGYKEAHFKEAFKQNPDVPSFCSELYPGWLTHWGEEWQRRDTKLLIENIRWLMDHKKSFNLYVAHGGTNFGFWAGANAFSQTQYMPDITSYDYDAPINEMGQPTPKYFAIRDLLSEYRVNSNELPPLPEPLLVIEIPEIKFTGSASLWDNLPTPIASVQPKPMEMFGQNSGFILYRTKLLGCKKGKLQISDLHDYATVFVDEKYIGSLYRGEAINTLEIENVKTPNPQIDILVEGMGRINFSEYMIDRKGITDRVSLNRMTLMNWEIFTLPFNADFIEKLDFTSVKKERPGILYKGVFHLDNTGDTYIDMDEWEKGVVWVNGHNLGRYWKIGPQKRLYCPAVFLKKGKNEIVVFDQHATEAKEIKGVKTLE